MTLLAHILASLALDIIEAVIVMAVLWHFWPQIQTALGGMNVGQ